MKVEAEAGQPSFRRLGQRVLTIGAASQQRFALEHGLEGGCAFRKVGAGGRAGARPCDDRGVRLAQPGHDGGGDVRSRPRAEALADPQGAFRGSADVAVRDRGRVQREEWLHAAGGAPPERDVAGDAEVRQQPKRNLRADRGWQLEELRARRGTAEEVECGDLERRVGRFGHRLDHEPRPFRVEPSVGSQLDEHVGGEDVRRQPIGVRRAAGGMLRLACTCQQCLACVVAKRARRSRRQPRIDVLENRYRR